MTGPAASPKIAHMKESILAAFADSARVKQQFAHEHADRIAQVARLMAAAFRDG